MVSRRSVLIVPEQIDHDVAGHDTVAKMLELVDVLGNVTSQRVRVRHISKREL
jgi:hypothetical protein